MQRALPVALLVALLFQASVQDACSQTPDTARSVGVIVYAEGREIAILRAGARSVLDVGLGDAIGELLLPGDQVTTGEATHAEIQLLTGSNIVRIAENTTFTVAEVDSGADTTLGVTFGRLRARVGELLGNERFQMRGLTAVAGVRGTDFGYDQLLDPASGELVTRIYCFDGEVRIATLTEPQAGIAVRAGEMAVVPEDAAAEDVTLEVVAEEIAEFWAARPFVREPATVGELRERFPDLPERVREQLGSLPPVFRTAEQEAGAESRPDEADGPGDEAEIDQPDEPGGEPLVRETQHEGDSDAARREEQRTVSSGSGWSRGLCATGVVLTSAGVLTELAAVGLFYYGADLVPGWTSADNEVLRPVAAAGLGALAGGIVSILLSLAVD